MSIEIVVGDITKAEVDIIVNAANPQMLGGGGVDGAIHAAAGPALLAACKDVKEIDGVRCPFGQARITQAGDLPAKYVVHTVGPIYNHTPNPACVLESAYLNSLELAVEHGARSIAFPAISCGVYGYPIAAAAEVALEVCGRPQFQHLATYFYLFNAEIATIWQSQLHHLA